MTYSPARRASAVAMYERFGSSTAASRLAGVDKVTVIKWARDAGVPVPSRGRPRKASA